VKYDPNATPPQFTNNEDTSIEPQTHVRVKIIGTRTEVGEMWAIGSIKEDYLGYADAWSMYLLFLLMLISDASKLLKLTAVLDGLGTRKAGSP
jgi:hypothetical protein